MAIPKGAADSAETIRAVILADGENVNQELIEQGYGSFREDLGGAESRAMHGALGIQIGRLAEGLGLFILPHNKNLARARSKSSMIWAQSLSDFVILSLYVERAFVVSPSRRRTGSIIWIRVFSSICSLSI